MTPLPWAAEPDDREGMEWNIHIVEAARPHMRVAFTSNGPDSEANAAFIVKAVNAHDALVQALRDILTAEDEFRQALGDHWEGDPLSDACDAARATILADLIAEKMT